MADRYARAYHREAPAANPLGPSEGDTRVLRGRASNYPAQGRGPGTPAPDDPPALRRVSLRAVDQQPRRHDVPGQAPPRVAVGAGEFRAGAMLPYCT